VTKKILYSEGTMLHSERGQLYLLQIRIRSTCSYTHFNTRWNSGFTKWEGNSTFSSACYILPVWL